MRNGNFSCPELQAYLGTGTIDTCNANGSSHLPNASYNNIGFVPILARGNSQVTNGQIDPKFFDKTGTLPLLNTLPLPNAS